jgi:hypothetical protein
MKRCYKCQKPYVEPNGPGFQEVCESCSSYLHCCQNCYFYDPYQPNSCTEPVAEYVSDSNGMNHCEYFQFKAAGGRKLGDDEGGRRFRKADFRNLNKDQKKDGSPARRRGSRDIFASGGQAGGGSRGSRPSPFGGGSSGGRGGGNKAQKAREALEKLFKKE